MVDYMQSEAAHAGLDAGPCHTAQLLVVPLPSVLALGVRKELGT